VAFHNHGRRRLAVCAPVGGNALRQSLLLLVTQDGASARGNSPVVQLERGAVVVLGHPGLVALCDDGGEGVQAMKEEL